MRLVDRLVGRRASLLDTMSQDTTWALSQSYGSGDREPMLPTYMSYAIEGFGSNSVVFGCSLMRAQLFAEAQFRWRNLADKHLFHTDALGLLEAPWPGATSADLFVRAEQDVTVAGNSFIRKVSDMQLERLRPDCVTIISELVRDEFGRQVRNVLGYAYNAGMFDPGREMEMYTADEVAHWAPIPDPLASFRGMSWITPVVREIDADTAMTKHKLKHLDNAATPNMVVKYQRRLKPQDYDEIRSRWESRWGGPDNAGRALIIDDGSDVTPVGSNLKDLDFGATQGAGALRIAFAAGIPPELIPGPVSVRLPDSVYNAAINRLANLTIRPMWRGFCGNLGRLVNAPGGSELWFDTTDIAALQPGEQDAATAMQLQAATANTLIMAGYTPESVILAVVSGDMTLLKHSGLVSVQMQSVHGAPALPKATTGSPIDGGEV